MEIRRARQASAPMNLEPTIVSKIDGIAQICWLIVTSIPSRSSLLLPLLGNCEMREEREQKRSLFGLALRHEWNICRQHKTHNDRNRHNGCKTWLNECSNEQHDANGRSEERRVGKECRYRW